MSLLTEKTAYKPFDYPWAYDAWKLQQKMHWLPDEVPLGQDIKDWNNNLTAQEKNLLTQIFRFFTQADIEVNDCYMTKYAQVFKPVEIKMMLSAFSNMETVHIDAYSHLLDTVGMPETEYQAFLEYTEMRDKHEYTSQFNVLSNYETAKTMAVFGAFTEGLQLFASFAILLNFTRFNKMKGMGQIITWSVRDETLHCESIIKLYHEFVKETLTMEQRNQLNQELIAHLFDIVAMEDKFIDLAFEAGEVEGLSPQDVKDYIRYIANLRLQQLGISPVYEARKNPLPWMEEMLNIVEHTNFFENQATEYGKASTQGDWEDVWS